MFRKRGLILVTLSLVMGLGAAMVARGWVADQANKEKADVATVVAATMAVPFGTKLEERHLKLIQMPKDSVPPGSFMIKEEVIDKVSTQPIVAGEILMKAPHMMKEYWNRPDATEDSYDDGWFCTGDIAEIDEEGFIFIKDRIKDMIISGGENIYPAEVENVILAHTAVTEVAVIGLPDEKWGETTCAIVVSSDSGVDEQAIIDHCEEKLSRYKLPRKVIFVESIPRNPSGKILKRVLRDQFA